jgi:phosphatidylglycerol:prolipoprotein diacylglycerol transferase
MSFALPVLAFPAIDPVAVSLGPIDIRWYALAYIAGLILGWRIILRQSRAPGAAMSAKQVDDFVVWATIGVILGGRLGYVLFYRPAFYFENPLEILFIWQGGMSFHGGLLGVMAAILLFSPKYTLNAFGVADMIATAAPIGLFFGRIANFINAELWGRASDLPWAMVFPTGGAVPRHPSQLYEAALEGVLLFVVLYLLLRLTSIRTRPGALTGVFIAGYGLARLFVEFFREPDAHLGFLLGGATMGQLLSLPLVAFGLWLIVRTRRHPHAEAGT